MKLREFLILIKMIDRFIDHKKRYPKSTLKPPDIMDLMASVAIHESCCDDIMDKALASLNSYIRAERSTLI